MRPAAQNLQALLERAVASHQAGNLEEAERCYRAVLKGSPDEFDVLHHLGLLLAQRGRHAEAVLFIRRALQLNPQSPEANANLGNVLLESKLPEEALVCFGRALALAPDNFVALYNRGNAFRTLKRDADALASYAAALSIEPLYLPALVNRGVLLNELNRHEEALDSFHQALALNPEHPGLWVNLGISQRGLKRYEEALGSYGRALALQPDYAEAFGNRGNVLMDLKRYEEALADCDRALALAPDYAEARLNRACILAERGRREEVHADLQRVLASTPDNPRARWALVMNTIPIVARANENPLALRADFARELASLDAWFAATQIDGHEQVGQASPFYLAYQEANHRDLISAYGKLCCRLMQRWQVQQAFTYPGGVPGRAKRVGILSAYIRNHSVWHALVKGWLRHLDHNRIELHVFMFGPECDHETTWAKANSASFTQGDYSLHDWVNAILGKRLDALIYPDIGMHDMTMKLASLRLAPVQVAAWGHPETTGLPTIDYYLSAAAFEPPDAQENYTERLITLPNLGCCYAPLPVTSIDPDLRNLHAKRDVPMLICPGTPFKYAPQNDAVFVAIARKLGKCQLVFFEHSIRELSTLLEERLTFVFRQSGLSFAEYGVFIPWQDPAAFYGLMKRADVLLDTIGFSGFNTVMQAIECGLPVVTREGRFLRGRLGSGILRRMGLDELVVASNEDYVDLAVRLACDKPYSQSVRRNLEGAREILLNDPVPVRALGEFLDQAVSKT